MGSQTPIIALPLARVSRSDNTNVNASIILIPDGFSFTTHHSAVLAQSVRVFAYSRMRSRGHIFEFQPRQTCV